MYIQAHALQPDTQTTRIQTLDPFLQETAFRQAIPFFYDVVLLYDSIVGVFGDTARTVRQFA
jgi:hypothetical protein